MESDLSRAFYSTPNAPLPLPVRLQFLFQLFAVMSLTRQIMPWKSAELSTTETEFTGVIPSRQCQTISEKQDGNDLSDSNVWLNEESRNYFQNICSRLWDIGIPRWIIVVCLVQFMILVEQNFQLQFLVNTFETSKWFLQGFTLFTSLHLLRPIGYGKMWTIFF